jgi:AcrR family transcriptional regulator
MKIKQKQRLKSDERKQAMLAAARELFLAKGYAATSLDDVVTKSGGSLATLYQLFGNKEGLWRELVQTYTARVAEPMADDDVDHGPPAVVLRDVARRLIALKMDSDVMAGLRIVMTEGGKFPDLARLLYENGPMAGERNLSAYLQRQVDAGTLDVPNVELAAHLFCGLVAGEHQLWTLCGINVDMTPDEIEKRVDEVVKLFLAAYQPKT